MKPLTALSDEDEVREHLCLPPEVNPQQPNPLTTEQQVREEQKKEVFMFWVCLFFFNNRELSKSISHQVSCTPLKSCSLGDKCKRECVCLGGVTRVKGRG